MKKVLFSLVAMLLLSVSGIAQTPTWTKITSPSELVAGTSYLIVGYDEALGYCAMSYQKSNNRHAIPVTENGGSITLLPASDASSETDAHQFVLMGSAGAWNFYDPLKEGYLYAASSSGNQLKTQTNNNANGEWSIEFNDDGTAVVTAQGENTRNIMRFNENSSNGTPLFSCYNSNSSINVPVSLYKAGGGTVEPDPEPSNYPTNFTATVNELSVTLTWTDATGGQLPAKYLVIGSTGNITVPTDGTPVQDGELVKNVNYGVQTVTFSGLQSNTIYHFAIFPYTNNSTNINYKTDGCYPTANAITESIDYMLFEDFNDGLGVFTAYNAYGDQEWHQGTNQGVTFANMNGYAAGASNQNEDWLIGYVPPIFDMNFTAINLEFRTAMKFDGDPLRVAVSGNYNLNSDPSDYDWIDITDAFNYSSGNYEWVESGKVNIIDKVGGFSGINGWYVAFIYTSNNESASSWEIDYVKVTEEHSASVTENDSPVIGLYPNPAREQVSFMLDDDAEVSIFDMTGRKVSETNVAAGQAQLNVSELENGVYFVNFRFANGTTTISKFVKF